MKLYLGLREKNKEWIHFPLIKVIPRPFPQLVDFTHILFTSQTAVDLFFAEVKEMRAQILAVGKETKKRIEAYGFSVALTAQEECAEGLIAHFQQMEWQGAHLFWPHSALSRPLISEFFQERNIPFTSAILYDVVPHLPGPLPDLETIDEIIFTSPSTVHAFLHFFGSLPKGKKLTPIGEVTKKTLIQSLSI